MRGAMFTAKAWRGLLLAFMGLAGCGGGDGSGDPAGGGPGPGFEVTLEMRATTSAVQNSFAFGESMVFALTIRNRSGATQVLNLPSGQIYDLAVLPEGSSTPRWRWSFNRSFPAVATSDTFGPNATITYIYIWNGVLEDGTQIMPGSYDFRGTLAYANYTADWRSNHELAAPLRRVTIIN
jgi:hypothetical protein